MLCDDFINYVSGIRRYSPRTQAIYSDVLSRYLDYSRTEEEPADDALLLKSLTPTAIRNYENHLSEEKSLSPRTVNQHLSVLSSLCKWLVSKGILKSNPVHLVKRPKCEKRLPVFYRQASMTEYLEKTSPAADEESLSMLSDAADSYHSGASVTGAAYKLMSELYEPRLKRMIVSTLYLTGIRRAELIGLRIRDIDLSRHTMKVRGKGDKMREIPLTLSLSKEISLYLKAAESVVGRKRNLEEPFLVTLKGAGLYPVFVDRTVKSELGQVEGITGRKSPHVLRHTLATELLDDGSDIYSIKELLGHSSLAATQVYTHNTIEKLKNVYSNAHPRAKRGGKNGD